MPTEWAYGSQESVPTDDPAGLLWIELVRPGVTTHSFDNVQRLVDLSIVARQNGSVQVATPATPHLAPPGWYMLFVVNQQRVPSVAAWVHLI